MILKNPDGAYTPARYIQPQIDGDIVSFSLDKCADPILQFKKMDGVNIMTSALNGFGYYFAFAYTDSAGNYGKATIKSIQIPSVLQKLEEELGISNWLALINIVRGDYEGIFNFLGLNDEFTFIRRAIASASLDRLMRELPTDLRGAVLSKVEKNLNDPEAKEMFDYLAKNGRLDDSYAAKLLEKVKEEINYDEAVKVLDQLDSSDLRKTYDYYIKQLPLEKRKELLGQVYDKKDEIQRMSDAEVNKRLSAAMREKEKAIKIIKSLDLTEQVNLVKDFITQQPAKLLNIVNNAISDDKKAQAIRNVLTTASEKYKGLLRLMMSIASPDLQKIAFDAITNIPGLEEYKDSITQIFSDFEGGSCQ
jgi:virulence-associated protein VapD